MVVEDDQLQNPNMEMGLTEAHKIDPEFEVGEVSPTSPAGRFREEDDTEPSPDPSTQTQPLQQTRKLRIGEVYQVWKKELLLLDDEHNELILPKTEQIPSDFFRKGEHVRAIVARVENKNNNPKIILSRTSPVFLERLFEMEIPEITTD